MYTTVIYLLSYICVSATVIYGYFIEQSNLTRSILCGSCPFYCRYLLLFIVFIFNYILWFLYFPPLTFKDFKIAWKHCCCDKIISQLRQNVSHNMLIWVLCLNTWWLSICCQIIILVYSPYSSATIGTWIGLRVENGKWKWEDGSDLTNR